MREFDKIIRNKMRNSEAAYPDDMWQRIQKNLPEKKRKVYPVWMMVTIVFIATGALAVFFHNSDTNAATKKSTGTDREVLAVVTENSEAKSFSSASSPGTQAQHYTTSQSDNISMAAQDNNLKSFQTNNQVVADNSNAIQKANSSNQNIEVSTDQDRTTNSEIETAAPASHMVSNPEEEVTNSAQKLTRRGEKNNAPVIASFLRVFGTDQSDVIESINTSMKRHSVLQCPTFVRKDNLTFFELYFSNDYAFRSLTAKSPEYLAYQTLRENTENSYLSYSAGFRVGIGWNNGIALKTGVNYSSINEKFSYTDPNSVQVKTITIIKYIYDDQFNVVDSIKTTENVSIPGTNTVTNFNKISMVDIPVLVQYTIPGRRRLSYNLVCGPLINLSLVQSGKILNSAGNEIWNLQDQNIYKNNVGLCFYGGIGINYQLTKNIQISIEPNARVMTSSVSRVTHPIDQKYWVASVAAAFRYKI